MYSRDEEKKKRLLFHDNFANVEQGEENRILFDLIIAKTFSSGNENYRPA